MNECILKFCWYGFAVVLRELLFTGCKRKYARADLLYSFNPKTPMEIFAREDVDKVI